MKHSEPNVPAYVGHMTIPELKNLIKECLREFEEEKLRLAAIFPNAEEQYKQMWKKPPIITDDGFKCGD